MTLRFSARWLAGFCWVGLAVAGCADPESAPLCSSEPAACQLGSGGAGLGTGGAVAATGGSVSTGGWSASTGGAVSATGGAISASGGATVATGGVSALGGVNATGGAVGTGGSAGTAGKASTGGASASGGNVGTGGVSTGGSNAGAGGSTGGSGTAGTAGKAATGGASSTGGASAGGANTGGASTGGVGGAGSVIELALGRPATAKGAQTANPVTNGNDGIPTTRFCAADGTTGNWWRVDLGAVHQLARVEIMWEFARQYGYLVELSSDDVSYTTAADLSATTDTMQTQTVPLSTSARYLRITIAALPASPVTWMSFFEVRVYGI